MPALQVSYNQTTRVALVQADAAAVPEGSVDVGSFDHPDEVYPDSVVIYHGVRDLLYKRSAADAAETAMFPENITDMQNVIITLDDTIFAVTGVNLNPNVAEVEIAATLQLETIVVPENAGDQGVTYGSSNEAVATVDAAGLVTAVAEGEAIITVTTDDGGFTDTCTVTVPGAE